MRQYMYVDYLKVARDTAYFNIRVAAALVSVLRNRFTYHLA